MAGQLTWKESVLAVLREAKEPMTAPEIVEEIVRRDLRQEMGATPSQTVAALIYISIKNEGALSPFTRPSPGRFKIRTQAEKQQGQSVAEKEQIEKESSQDSSETTGVVNAFGMFWERSKVDWSASQPRILGRQPNGTSDVDFCNQIASMVVGQDSHGSEFIPWKRTGRSKWGRISPA